MSDIEVIKEMINNTIITPRQKEALQNILEENEDLQNDYDSLDESYTELENEIYDLNRQIDELEFLELDNTTSILDIGLFKDKLELYGFASDDLMNFIDDYMKLYNKE